MNTLVRRTLVVGAIISVGSLGAHQAQAQTLYVSQFGDGSAALTSAATAGFIDKFNLDGTSAGTAITLPTTVAASGNRALTFAGSSTSEGQLGLSGTTLTLFGYNAAPGTTAIAGTTSATNNRVVGLINTTTGTVDTTTALTDAASGGNARSAAYDGTNIFVAGSTGGVRQTTPGATTSTAQSGTLTNARVVNTFSGTTYVSAASGAFVGINSLSGGVATNVVATGTNSSPYDFVFTNANTVYVTDDRTSASGGLFQYTNSGSGFTLTNSYNLAGLTAGSFAGLRSLTFDGTGMFYAISSDNRLVSFSTATSSFATIATAATNTAFRGVEFLPGVVAPVPEPSGVVALLIGAGALGLMVARRRTQRAGQCATG